MNFVAALMLLVVEEESAFWMLAYFCEDVNPGYYAPPMLGTQGDMKAMKDILQSEVPEVYNHVAELHLPLELWAAQWLLVYFINSFPMPTALRIMEAIMLEGSDVTFAVALAFLKLISPELLECRDLDELITTLKRFQEAMYDVEVLMAKSNEELERFRSRLRPCRAWHLR